NQSAAGWATVAATEPALIFRPDLLRPFCRPANFGAGDVLRRKGHHYTEMFILMAGVVEVNLETSGQTLLSLFEVGTPVGEIAFLRGCPATATVKAKTDGKCLVIDDAALSRLEGEQPALASAFLHHLALTA